MLMFSEQGNVRTSGYIQSLHRGCTGGDLNARALSCRVARDAAPFAFLFKK